MLPGPVGVGEIRNGVASDRALQVLRVAPVRSQQSDIFDRLSGPFGVTVLDANQSAEYVAEQVTAAFAGVVAKA